MILIVDDEPANVLLLDRTLRSQGGFENIVSLGDPRLVGQALADFDPDIILLDLQMPHLDGFAVMRLIKDRIHDHEFVPILVLTADATVATKRKALAEGATDYLTKPFDVLEVLLRTRNLLQTRFLHQDLQGQKAVLEERVRVRTQDLEDAQREIIARLAKACEFRDDDTGEHTKRVGDLSGRIATHLGLTPRESEMIRLAAQVHDIGKTGIPDSILLKPGRLTADEMAIMRTHTTIGATILSASSAPLLRLAEEIALTHHEQWTAGGYPRGLWGEQIPLAGRIVAVTDVFDALTNSRPYKSEWPIQDAVDEIRRLSGRSFDPHVVDAFLDVLHQTGICMLEAKYCHASEIDEFRGVQYLGQNR